MYCCMWGVSEAGAAATVPGELVAVVVAVAADDAFAVVSVGCCCGSAGDDISMMPRYTGGRYKSNPATITTNTCLVTK